MNLYKLKCLGCRNTWVQVSPLRVVLNIPTVITCPRCANNAMAIRHYATLKRRRAGAGRTDNQSR